MEAKVFKGYTVFSVADKADDSATDKGEGKS